MPKKKQARSRKALPITSSDEKIPTLCIDIGGTRIKILAVGESKPLHIKSGLKVTPAKMVEAVLRASKGWTYSRISIGFPGLVGPGGPRSEPGNLGPGWVGFDFSTAFGKPVRIINDAAMQALGSYDGGRMLFLGLGTGLGSALITDNVIVNLELGNLPFGDGERLGDLLGRAGLEATGKKRWRKTLLGVLPSLMSAFQADYIVLGGGNSKHVDRLPAGVRLGHNLTAFRGGIRLWHLRVPELDHDVDPLKGSFESLDWKVL